MSSNSYSSDEYANIKHRNELPEYIIKINKKKFSYFPLKQGSYWSSIFFILFSTLGSGVIILPITMKNLGIIPASLCLALCAFISYYTVTILVIEGFNHHNYSFSELVEKSFGKKTLILVDISFHIGNLLGIIVFNKVIFSFITKFLSISQNETYYEITLVILLLIIQLFLTSDNFSHMSFIAFLGSTFVITLGLITILEFPINLNIYFQSGPDGLNFNNFNNNNDKPYINNHNIYSSKLNYYSISSFKMLMETICVYFYSFQYHAGSLIIIENLKEKSNLKIKSIFKTSVTISFCFYFIVMLLGYLSNPEQTEEIFINYDTQSVYLSIGKVLYSISLIFNISFTYLISQDYLEYLITFGNPSLLSERIKFLLKFITFSVMTILAFSFNSLIDILSLIGGSTQTIQMFIIPLLIHIKNQNKEYKKAFYYIFLIILVFIGTFSLGYYLINEIIMLS